MTRMLALLLLFGAVIGLLGEQTAASAAVVPMAMTAPAQTMDADCMALMGAHPATPDKKPCQGLTLDCIAATACAVPLMPAPDAPFAPATVTASQLFGVAARELAGTDRPPETPPPSPLG
ncbi:MULTISPECIES: hypothetical protein [unclassified Sphingomonas]|uniref:hypothetical protein n=1 Tax=unclassified Sphingomonas TaxID=196159 RepID=UPI00092BEEA0|nr:MULTISPECIES: hypothetical protein [unclassified Sphingomonas]OJU23153.1 MAG: hypothetical protein BGN95_15430 [Sphingomonas sp. 66-10]